MRRLVLLAATFVAALASSATGQTPASSLRALVYCPVAIDASGCDQIATALTGTFASVDKGYDGTAGTLDLVTADLSQYAVFVVPSLADGAGLTPYALLRDTRVAPRLANILRGRAAIWSGTPDQGAANRDAKNTLIRNLAVWAVQAYALTGRAGVVVLQDQSTDVAQRYAWLAGISDAAVTADPNSEVYDAVESLTAAGTEILSNGQQPAASLAYANMASFGLHLPVDATGTLAGALGATSNRQVVLVTYQGGEGPTEFYIQAHQDDWQLFSGNRTAASVRAASKVVFVYTTAGDAGSTTHYWQTREKAAKASIDAIAPGGAWACAPQTVGAHAIHRCTKANTVSYFLRLPDGNGEGQGYHDRGSLAQLRGVGRDLVALDGTATYASWDELVSTIQALMVFEAAGQPDAITAVHAQDWEVIVNGGDHSDHVATGDLTRAASWGHAWNLFWYMGYPNVFQPVNVTGGEYVVKWSTIVAYDDAIKGDYGTILGARAEEWAARTIFRSEPSSGSPLPRPAAPASLVASAVDGSRIDLTWVDTFTDEAGFRVERAPDISGSAGGFVVNATLPPNTTSWPSIGLPENTRFWYRVRAFTAAGSSAYSAELSATTAGSCVAPAITVNPVSASRTSGQAVTFSVTATGTGTLVYQWRLNGVAIPLATASDFGIDPARSEDAGNYDVVVSNACGAATSAVATLAITKVSATVLLSELTHTYDGTEKSASFTTSPADLPVTLTYNLNDSPVAAPVSAGEYAVTATINAADYEGSTGGTLTIARATPTISWANPASITHGTVLSGIQLNAFATGVDGEALPGSFGYTPADGTVLSAGTHPLMTAFAPTDGVNYTGAARTVTIDVLKAAPVFGSLSSTTIAYGTSSLTLTGHLGLGGRVPSGNVVIALGGGSQTAPLQADGSFSASFSTAGLNASATPYSISYTYGGDANFSAATDNSTTLTVDKATASIALTNLSHSYDGTAKSAVATTSPAGIGGVTVVYRQGQTIVTPINAGSYTVEASLDNPNYRLAGSGGPVTGTLVIAGASLSVTAGNASRVYGGANPSFAGTISGALPGDLISATYGSVANATSPAGSYAVVPTLVDPQGKLANYAVTQTNGTLTVTRASLTVTPANAARLYGDNNPTFTGAIEGLKNGDAISATYSTPATATSAIGSYDITATLVDATPSRLANYQVTQNTGTLTVGVAPLSITANAKSRVYGGANPVFDGVITGIRNNDAISATYATVATAASAVGGYQITATATGAPATLGNYAITTNVGTLAITPAPLTVKAAPATKLYGAALPAFNAAYEGFVLGQGPSVLGGTLAFATTASAASNVGTYSVTPSGLTATNYAITFAPGALTVSRAPLTVTADNKNKQYDGQAFTAFTASYTGFVLGQGPTVLGGALSFSGPAIGATDFGTYAVTPAGVTSDNYAIGFVAGSLSIGRPTLTVTAASTSREYGAANPTFTGTVTGVIAGDGITATYASTANAASAIGSYAIVPTLADPDGNLVNYAVTMNNGAVTVTPAPLTVTPENRAKTYGQAMTSLSGSIAGIRNGDAITATYASAGGAAASAVGSYAITATLNGAPSTLANYAVTGNTGTLTVNPAALTVTADDKNKQYDGAAFTGFTASYAGFVLGQGPAVLGGALGFSGPAAGATAAGTYAIVPTGVTSTNYQIAFVPGSLQIGRPTLTVTAASTSREYGAPNPTFTGIVNGLIASDGITASYGSTAVATSPVGPYAIVPTLADPNGKLANYAVTVNNGTLSVTTAPLTVTPENRSKTYGQEMTSFSGSIVGIKNSDAITASYASAGGAATSAVGSYDIMATLNGSPSTLDNYAVTRNTGTLTVNAAPLTVKADDKSRGYGTSNPAFTASYTGFVLGQTPSILQGTLAFATAATAASDVGTYSITPSGLTATNYAITFSTGMLTIGTAPVTVTVNNGSRMYGASNPTFTVSIDGLIGSDALECTAATAATAASPIGNYPITATCAASAKYRVSTVPGTLTILKAPLTVTPANAERSYGDANPAFTGSLQGIRNNDDITATYSTAATATSVVGPHVITATLNGAPATLGNYIVSPNTGTLTITAAALSIVANNATREYGAGNPPFVGVITGTKNNEAITATYATTATTGSPVGTYAITPTAAAGPGASLSNYAVTVTNGALGVTAAPLTVTPVDRTKIYGQSVTDFTGSIVGIRNNDDITASYASPGSAVASAVGSYVITATLQGAGVTSGNYVVTRNNGVLTVARAPLTVKANDATRYSGEANPPFTATYNGFVAGETQAALGGSLTFTTAATASSPAGEYPVTPGGVTSSNYAITFVAGKLLIITKATPTITWSPVDVTNPAPLGATQLNAVAYGTNGTTPVTGTYVYSSNGTTVTTGTVLPPGVNVPLTVTFTPTGADASNYGPATMTVTTFNVLAKIDITPGSTSNAISLAGTQTEVVVGVVSSANFDARTLVVSGVTPTLGDGTGAETPVAKNTNGTPKTGLTDLNADGRLDVMFYFKKATLISNGDVVTGTTKLFLQGQFSDGRMIKGVDKVSVIP